MRKNDAIILNGMGEMNGILITAQADIGRNLDIMACLTEQPSEECAGGIVVQIELHRRLSRDISSGESTRGLA